MNDTTAAYSNRAAEYTEVLGAISAMHHADVHLIGMWAAMASGRLLDAGCGPGHWTHHLASRGADIRGIDLVPEFIDHARAAYSSVRFDVESIDAIKERDERLDGVLSWFSTIHHEPSRIAVPIAEFARVLRPGGTLLLGYFEGAQTYAAIAIAMVVMTIGPRTVMTICAVALVGAMPENRTSMGTALNDTAQEVGTSIGTAFVGTAIALLVTTVLPAGTWSTELVGRFFDGEQVLFTILAVAVGLIAGIGALALTDARTTDEQAPAGPEPAPAAPTPGR